MKVQAQEQIAKGSYQVIILKSHHKLAKEACFHGLELTFRTSGAVILNIVYSGKVPRGRPSVASRAIKTAVGTGILHRNF